MRAACRKFLDRMGDPDTRRLKLYPREAGMWEALGELRGVFGLHVARLCAAYGVDVEPELGAIFPAAHVAEGKAPGKPRRSSKA